MPFASMTAIRSLLFVLYFAPSFSFSPFIPPLRSFQQSYSASIAPALFSSTDDGNADVQKDTDPLADMDQERRENLYKCLLRDLQIEQVPLLEVDVDQLHTLQAAIWTIMAELSENANAQRVCLVLEEIGVDALRVFQNDFTDLKSESQLMEQLPELQRFNISVVGKGVGPALLVETGNATMKSTQVDTIDYDESKVAAAMEKFVDRISASIDLKGDAGPIIAYRCTGSSDLCLQMSGLWNCVCEMMVASEDQLSSVMLILPGLNGKKAPDSDGSQNRFAAIAELISRSLGMARSDENVEIQLYHPEYDRDLIQQKDKDDALGHLLPTSMLRPMLLREGYSVETNKPLGNELRLAYNLQRRSPFPAILLKRRVRKGENDEIINLEMEDGNVEKVSSRLSVYARNAIKLAEIGQDKLQDSLQTEIANGNSWQ